MGSIKVAILEKDGEEYDCSVEMDLLTALAYVGFTGSGFNENLILCSERFESLYDQNGNILVGI